MSSGGIKMSKPNVDVETAEDKDLSWSSDFKTFKVYRIIHFEEEGTEAHGLDYPPTFIAYERIGSDWKRSGAGYMGAGIPTITVDSTNVYSGTSGVWWSPDVEEVYVILFIDPLNE